MILKSGNFRLYLLAVLFLPILIALLAGCDFNIGGTSQTAPATPTLDFRGKGPGSVNLTATARATPVATVCPTISAAPASTSGWKLYKDTHFPFQFSVPPGWRTGRFTDSSADGTFTYYTVMILPSASTASINAEGAMGDSEHFEITVILTGPQENLGNGSSWKPETSKVTIDNTRATIYDRVSTECEEVGRIVQANFGQRNYDFYLTVISGKAKEDLALFLGMVQSFMYTG